jgi:hypothetical protein
LIKNKGLNNNFDLWTSSKLSEKQKFIPAKHAKHLRGLEGVKAPKHVKKTPKFHFHHTFFKDEVQAENDGKS